MDFDKYVDCLTQIDNEENRAELETLYALNSAVLKFFPGIDNSICEVLKGTNVSSAAIKSLEKALPSLSKLKKELSRVRKEQNSLTAKYKANILNLMDDIQSTMTLSEVPEFEKEFFELLQANINEQARLQAEEEKRRQQEEEEEKERCRREAWERFQREEEERLRREEEELRKQRKSIIDIENLESALLRGDSLDTESILKLATHSKRESVLLKCAQDNRIAILKVLEQNPHITGRVRIAITKQINAIKSNKTNKKNSGCILFIVGIIIIFLVIMID